MNKYVLFIYDEMRRQKMPMAELARRSGVTDANICNYFAGKRNPGLENFTKMLDALGYEIVYHNKNKEN